MKRYVRAGQNDWDILKSQLAEECAMGMDPLYEDTDAGSEILEVVTEVEKELKLFVEPGGYGNVTGLWIFDDETGEVLVENYNLGEFDDVIYDLCLESDSKEDFKRKVKIYYENIIQGGE